VLYHSRRSRSNTVLLWALWVFALLIFSPLASAEISINQRQKPSDSLFNTTCAVVHPDQLSWFETYGKQKMGSSSPGPDRAFGVQKNDGWFYLWDVDPQRGDDCKPKQRYKRPICSVQLKNYSGNPVPGSWLSFLGMMDLDGTGQRNYLVGIQGTSSNWTYIWRVDPLTCGSGVSLVADGSLKNYQGTAVAVSSMHSIVIGDFDRDGKDELRVLQKGGSWNYVWKIDANNRVISLFSDGNLRNGQGALVAVDNLTFVDVADIDGHDTSNVQETSLVAIQSGVWGYRWGLGENAIGDFPLCTGVECARKSLIFSLDQGFMNGLPRYDTSTPGVVAVYGRMLDTLKELQSKYVVHVLVNPLISNKSDRSNLYAVLDLIVGQGVSFYLDVYSSDNTMITIRQPAINNVADVRYGLGPLISGIGTAPVTLQEIHNRYGAYFTGIRIFETAAQDFAESLCVPASICGDLGPYVVPEYFQESKADPNIAFAKANGKSVLLTDHLWGPWDPSAQGTLNRFRTGVGNLAQRYPGTIYTSYSNNESFGPVQRSGLHRVKDWSSYLQFVGNKGIALSNQSWMCDRKPGFDNETCPPEYMVLWTGDALRNKGASLVQFEPFWYLFNWQVGSMETREQLNFQAPEAARLGKPTRHMCMLSKSLGVDLSACVN
jgi:hypothetical protein